jgi:RNA polymerase sigma-70 factor (family 1)
MVVTDPYDEKKILIEFRYGNKQAFNLIYNHYNLQIYRKLLKMTRIDTIAQELTQDLFIKIWEKCALIDPDKPFKSYLYQIAGNLVYDFYRKLAREERLQKEVQVISTELYTHTEENIILQETQKILDMAVEGLPIQQKRAFTLCKFEGKSYEETAEILGISVVTVNTHIVRATKSIKSFIFSYQNIVILILLIT